MPTSAASGPRGFTRRDGLRAVSLLGPVALLTACTQGGDPDPTDSAAAGSAAATTAASGTAEARDESLLIARYDAVLADPAGVPPGAVAVLQSIRDQHIAHRDALGGASDVSAPASTVTAWPTVLAGLADAERVASRSRIRACVDSADAELARLLTLIGASEAAHVPALRELGS